MNPADMNVGGMAVIPAVSSGPWILTIGEDENGDCQVQAITEDDEETGDGIDALEHRFLLGLPCDEEGGPEFEEETEVVAVYRGVQIHTCQSRPDDSEEECELFRPTHGEVEAEDVSEEVVEPVGELFSDEVFVPTPEDLNDDGGLPGVVLVSEASDEQIAALDDGEEANPRGFY